MANSICNLVNVMINTLSFSYWDDTYAKYFRESFLFLLWQKLNDILYKFIGNFAWLGNFLQNSACFVVILLFVILGFPQFANDKEALAIVIAFALTLRLVGTILGGRQKYFFSIVDGLVLLFFAINIIAAFSSHYLMPSLHGLMKLAVYIGAYFLFVAIMQINRTQRIFAICAGLVLCGFAVACYGLYQYKIGVAPLATWEDPTIEDKVTRIYSTLNNPNLLAGYLLPILPISMVMTIITFLRNKMWRIASLFFLISSISIFLAIILTGSRGAYIGLACSLFCFFVICMMWLWQKKPKTRIFLVLICILLPVIALFAIHSMPSLEHRITSIFVGREHSSNSYRLNVWHSSYLMFLDNWWFGIGPGNKTFRLIYGLYMESGFDALGTYCVPLEIAVETGIFGLIAFFAMLIVIFARAHIITWLTENAYERWLVIGAITAIVGIMSHGLVDTVFYRPQVQFIFWLMVAIVVACSLPQQNQIKDLN
jgi:putative inorganic carbon (HCO3(-)) transporter